MNIRYFQTRTNSLYVIEERTVLGHIEYFVRRFKDGGQTWQATLDHWFIDSDNHLIFVEDHKEWGYSTTIVNTW